MKKRKSVKKYKVIENASFDNLLFLSGQIIWIEEQNGTAPNNWRGVYSENGGLIFAVKNEDFEEFSELISG